MAIEMAIDWSMASQYLRQVGLNGIDLKLKLRLSLKVRVKLGANGLASPWAGQ